ncbi:MAG: hypothetical protein Q4D62_11470 [Planctomycetia bacterium]|nr:hypothetical protein [Planctomycetia bacterium]
MGRPKKLFSQRNIRAMNKLLYGDRRFRPENRVGLLVPLYAPHETNDHSDNNQNKSIITIDLLNNTCTPIQSENISQLTSHELENIRNRIRITFENKKKLYKFLCQAIDKKRLFLSKGLGIPYLFYTLIRSAKYKKKIRLLDAEIQSWQRKYEAYFLNLKVPIGEELKEKYRKLQASFKKVCHCCYIWDAVERNGIADVQTEQKIHHIYFYNKKTVTFTETEMDILKYEFPALFLGNANGADLYIFPRFIILLQSNGIAVLDIREIQLEGKVIPYIETSCPHDAHIVDYKWSHARKNGSQDMRYKQNFQIPIVHYFQLNLTSVKGLNESYIFSNRDYGENFYNNFKDYIQSANQKFIR